MHFRRAFGDRLSRGTGDSMRPELGTDSLDNPLETLGDLEGLLEERDRSACCCKDVPVTSSLTKTPRIWRMQVSQTLNLQDMNFEHSKSVCTTLKDGIVRSQGTQAWNLI